MSNQLEFTPYLGLAASAVEGPATGLRRRVIAWDEQGRIRATILEFAPGCDTTANGVQRHPDFREEVCIIAGSMTDLTLGQTFTAGSVASRPPGMPHGPWASATGCTTYEVRCYVDGNDFGCFTTAECCDNCDNKEQE